MIKKLSHMCIWVLDQAEAKDFYSKKLGFSIHTDSEMGPGMRWVTVCPPGQPDMELTLLPIVPFGSMTEADAATLKDLVANRVMGLGVFETDDIQKTYEELIAVGVEITPPEKQFYGTECVVHDNSGNWFSITQLPS